MTTPGNKATRWGPGVAGPLLLAALFLAFVALCAAKVASLGLCCADDGYFASIAKNLAVGPGYGTTVSAEGFRPFDPEIGTGPTLIVPVALATWILGNRYWVPGAATIALWALLLVLVHRALRGLADVRNASLASSVFLVGTLLLFPYHLEHWHAMLGEVPAALLLLLGLVVVGRADLSRRNVVLASLLWSLAYLTKTVAAFHCAAFFAALGVRTLLLERRPWRELRVLAVDAAVAFAAPLLAFETYKLLALGGVGAYGRNLAEAWYFLRQQGVPRFGIAAGRWARAMALDRGFADRFGLSVVQMALASVAWAALLLRRGGRLQRAIALPGAAGVLLSCGWFLFFSIGWPRYLIVTVVLFWALTSLVLTVPRRAPALALGAVLILLLFGLNRHKLGNLRAGLEGGLFARSPALANALELTAFIDAHAGGEVFANQWWATTADLEYYARSVDVFRKYTLVDRPGEFYVVFNRRFKSEEDAAFNQLIATCRPVERTFEPYALLRCRR